MLRRFKRTKTTRRGQSSNSDALLSPMANFRRTETLTCARHPKYGPILPASVCPFCRWPEEIVTFPTPRTDKDKP